MILIVLLTILKIIGIILLSILGLVLFLLLIVLFVPIRYKAEFLRTGIDNEPPIEGHVTVSWLLHIIHINAEYVTGLIVCARVFGIPVYRIPAKAKTAKQSLKNKTHQKSSTKSSDSAPTKGETTYDNIGEPIDKDNPNAVNDNVSKLSTNIDSETNLKNDSEININDEINKSDNDSYISENENVVDLDEPQNGSIFSRIISLIHNIKCTCKRIYDKIKNGFCSTQNRLESTKKNIHYYHTILTSELFERTFEKCKKKVLKLLKEVFPRKIDIKMEVGLEDPYTMGELLGLAGIMYPLCGEHVKVIPNWEEVILRGGGRIKGRIYIFSFVKLFIFYLTNRDLKKVIRLLKKEERRNGRK